MKKLCMGLLVLPFLFACGTKVERLDTHEIKDVSGRWNDTDSQMVAQEMINDCLNSGWYNKATLRLGKEPTVIVGTVTNDSMEHINTNAFVEEMDFLSIGTNDLIQYLIAVDRVNPEVAHMYDPCHPAVVRTIRQIIQTAHQRGRQVSICGEIASDVRMVPMLLGLEVDTLSVPPRMFLRIKNRIRNLNFEACSDMAQAALLASSSEEIRKLIETQSQDEDS